MLQRVVVARLVLGVLPPLTEDDRLVFESSAGREHGDVLYFNSSVWLCIWLQMNVSDVPVCVSSTGTAEHVWHLPQFDLHLMYLMDFHLDTHACTHLSTGGEGGEAIPLQSECLYFIHAWLPACHHSPL